MMNSLFSWLLLLLLSPSVVWSTQPVCNYVVNTETGVAWATEVCIPWNARDIRDASQFIKYSCATETDNDTDTVYAQFHAEDDCSDAHSSRLNMKDYVTGNSSEGLLFDCSGIDACYVGWIDNCNISADSGGADTVTAHLVFSPVSTCVSLSDESSFRMECDEDDFVYQSFPDSSDCSHTSEWQQWSISGCSYVSGMHYNEGGTAEFAECDPRPTEMPSQAPSTLVPSQDPSAPPTRPPSIYIPWYNLTLDEIIHELEGDGDDSSALRHGCLLTVLVAPLFALTLLIL